MATEVLVEEVAANLEEAAAATRSIDPKAVSFFVGGVAIGVAVGFYFGYRFNREKIRAEAFKKSEEEVEEIRKVYQSRMVVPPKPSVEDLVEEKGYSQAAEVEERPLPAPVPLVQEPFTRSEKPFAKRTEDGERDKHDGWDYPTEIAQRSPEHPYIIHQDEFSTNETGYNQTTYTYYAGDDILADEHDTVLNNAEELVGLDNLTKWGHGSDDVNILYICNSLLEMEFEICRSPGSYEEEVMGLEHPPPERMSRRDRRPDNDEPD